MRRVRCEGYTLWIGGPVPPGATAMTLGRHITMRPEGVGNDRLLRHELVHVRQYQEHGLVRFLWRYLVDYLHGRRAGYGHWDAYLRIPFEVEAEWEALRGPIDRERRRST